MHQFWTENLQPLTQFFDQVVDIFFDVRSFAISITDMNIHAQASDHGRDSAKSSGSLQDNSTPGFCETATICDRQHSFFEGTLFRIVHTTKPVFSMSRKPRHFPYNANRAGPF